MAQDKIAKARLIELDESLKNEASGGKSVTVQFNPDTLKLAFANQIQNSNPSSSGSGSGGGGGGGGGGDQASGTSGRQFVGAGTTKLTVQLWFDAATATEGQVDDVRRLTQQVIYFITPKKSQQDASRFVPPGVRFSWGSFLFDGLIDSIEESIEYFSPDGKPLRASISLGMSQQTILVANFDSAARPPGTSRGPGASPLTVAAGGSTLQGLAAAAGGDWQRIAAANGIDNPRQLQAGQLIDLNARLPRSLF